MRIGDKRVSVVVCTYNGEKFLREQLDSILNQTYPLYEIIIEDDCSTDDTWMIIQKYQSNYPALIKGFKNEHNLFWNQNFYAGVSRATGEYIALCDQDDIWHPTKIERQIDEIGDNLLHICSSNLWMGELIEPRYSEECTLEQMFFHFPYCGHQFLMASEMKEYVGLGQRIDMAHDTFFALVAKYKNSLVVSNELLVDWRRHESNSSHEMTSESISGKKKVLFALRCLIKGKKASVISYAANKYYQLFLTLDMQDGSLDSSHKIVALWRAFRDQTVMEYIKAGLIVFLLRKNIDGINGLYSAMTFPFRWWYIHKDNL